MAERRFANPADIRLLVLDVDGVLTDGSIYYDDAGTEVKRFNIRDGVAIHAWRRVGREVAILTGRRGHALWHRARELSITHVVQGSQSKGEAIEGLCEGLKMPLSLTAYVGDDWPDLPAMARAGYPIAVADAEAAVLEAAAFTTTRHGGRGAVREAIEHLLSAQGLLERALAHYRE